MRHSDCVAQFAHGGTHAAFSGCSSLFICSPASGVRWFRCISSPLITIGSVVGPAAGAWAAGWIFGLFGSCRRAFTLSIAAYLCSCIAFRALRRPPHGKLLASDWVGRLDRSASGMR